MSDRRGFRSLLIPVDLSPASDRLIARVALLPLAEHARLTLLHIVPGSLPPRARQLATADARRALEAEANSLSEKLPKGVHLEHVVKVGTPAVEIARLSRGRVELVVMGRGGGRTLRDAFLGSTAERVLRQSRRPVLVVRLPARTAYRQPAVALELDRAIPGILELLLRAVPPPRPRVEVIHAYDVPYHGMIYPSLSPHEADELADEHRASAQAKLTKLLAAALAQARVAPEDAPSWRPQVRHGAARSVIQAITRKNATDLLVLGTRGHAGLARAFLGTVAGDVLREVTCDVLMVPPRDSSGPG